MMLLSLWKRSTTSLTRRPWSKDTNEMELLCKARVTTGLRQRMESRIRGAKRVSRSLFKLSDQLEKMT
jgi:hypothetical protein